MPLSFFKKAAVALRLSRCVFVKNLIYYFGHVIRVGQLVVGNHKVTL